MMSLPTSSATSLQASAAGRTLLTWLGGLARAGRGPVPASPSPAPASSKASRTSGISGPRGSALSGSAALQSSLASRLKARFAGDGGTLFSETWKEKATPAGWRYWAHTASGRRTSGSGAGSWPTTTSGHRRGLRSGAVDVEKLASWPSPMAASPATEEYNEAGDTCNSRKTKQLLGWPSPSAQDGPKGGPSQGTDRLPAAASQASWATPTKRDHKDGASDGTVEVNALLGRQVWEAGWPTPNSGPPNDRDTRWEGRRAVCKARHGTNGFGLTLGMATQLSGPPPTGSPAATTSPGQLNPAHSRWLMGFPPGWDFCGAMATPLCRKSRRSSSQRTWVPWEGTAYEPPDD
jgi:hypothetical protein